MKWQQFLVDLFKRSAQEIEIVLNGLTTEDLLLRPAPGANPIGWLIWHATRSMDRTIGDVIHGEQLWIKEGWHKKFNQPADPQNTGYSHSAEQVSNLKIPDVKTLLEYNRAVIQVTLEYLENLTEEELSKEYPFSVEPGSTRPLYQRLIANIQDIQHIGQAGYVRGLLKGHYWYGH